MHEQHHNNAEHPELGDAKERKGQDEEPPRTCLDNMPDQMSPNLLVLVNGGGGHPRFDTSH